MASSARYAKIKIICYKSAFYGAALFLLAVLQVTFFTKINVLGATPDLLLGAVLTLAMLEDHKISSICGIIAGFFYCALGGFSYPLYMLFSFFCGYVLWGVSQHAFGKDHLSFLALSSFTYAAKGLFNMIEASLSSSSFSIINVIGSIVIPEFISSMIFCSISYLIFSGLTRIYDKSSKSRKDRIIK